MRVALVTNLCTHYRRPLFKELARRMDVTYFLTSNGREWYWPRRNETAARGLPGHAGGRRELVPALLRGGYDCIVASLAGRTIVPVVFLASRARRLPLVLWVGIWAHPDTAVHRLTRPLTRSLYRSADAMLVYGSHVADFVAAESGRTDNVFVAPQAVDGEFFRQEVPRGRIEALRRELAPCGEPVAMFVGRLEAEKGLDLLLRASAAASAPHTLLLAGAGSLEPELRRLADELGIARRVRFAGHVAQNDLPAYLRASDVLVLPSVTTRRVKEPWGLVANEAMSCGLPVIASDAVGAAAGGLVVDGQTGLVVPESNVPALAAALDRLFLDAALRSALGQAASERVGRYSFTAAADAFEAAVEAAVASCRRRGPEIACAS